MSKSHPKRIPIFRVAPQHWLLTACCLLLGGLAGCDSQTEVAKASIDGDFNYSVSHTFSINDVQGGYNGTTFANNPAIICGLPNSKNSECPDNAAQPTTVKKTGEIVYPIDSQFGYYVEDFVGAAEKKFDQNYGEGWVADLANGLIIANAKTVSFKAPKRTGSWCAGLGGSLVKCSTEHYTTMEHVLTCYESVPYTTDDPTSTDQKSLLNPENGSIVGNCSETKLDDNLLLMEAGNLTDIPLTSIVPGDQMEANESTIRDDIAVGKDYSITLKDDGKPLYRWGNAVKRPNDIRLYARMALPEEWKVPGAEFEVLKAVLVLNHHITNNPNDQVRPEDMENEAAIGQLPEYVVTGSDWMSSKECYEGDGDYIPAGTLFKNSNFTEEAAFSEDLQLGLTNAWYTTTDRDPFAAALNPDEDITNATGPRWRLKSNKFGQDIPSLEIPTKNCLQPPFAHGVDKYPVGDETVTTLNLLDFEPDIESPLASSLGWIDASHNEINIAKSGLNTDGNGISINGLPLTEDFDLAIYVKGDAKGTRLYDATLYLKYQAIAAEE